MIHGNRPLRVIKHVRRWVRITGRGGGLCQRRQCWLQRLGLHGRRHRQRRRTLHLSISTAIPCGARCSRHGKTTRWRRRMHRGGLGMTGGNARSSVINQMLVLFLSGLRDRVRNRHNFVAVLVYTQPLLLLFGVPSANRQTKQQV